MPPKKPTQKTEKKWWAVPKNKNMFAAFQRQADEIWAHRPPSAAKQAIGRRWREVRSQIEEGYHQYVSGGGFTRPTGSASAAAVTADAFEDDDEWDYEQYDSYNSLGAEALGAHIPDIGYSGAKHNAVIILWKYDAHPEDLNHVTLIDDNGLPVRPSDEQKAVQMPATPDNDFDVELDKLYLPGTAQYAWAMEALSLRGLFFHHSPPEDVSFSAWEYIQPDSSFYASPGGRPRSSNTIPQYLSNRWLPVDVVFKPARDEVLDEDEEPCVAHLQIISKSPFVKDGDCLFQLPKSFWPDIKIEKVDISAELDLPLEDNAMTLDELSVWFENRKVAYSFVAPNYTVIKSWHPAKGITKCALKGWAEPSVNNFANAGPRILEPRRPAESADLEDVAGMEVDAHQPHVGDLFMGGATNHKLRPSHIVVLAHNYHAWAFTGNMQAIAKAVNRWPPLGTLPAPPSPWPEAPRVRAIDIYLPPLPDPSILQYISEHAGGEAGDDGKIVLKRHSLYYGGDLASLYRHLCEFSSWEPTIVLKAGGDSRMNPDPQGVGSGTWSGYGGTLSALKLETGKAEFYIGHISLGEDDTVMEEAQELRDGLAAAVPSLCTDLNVEHYSPSIQSVFSNYQLSLKAGWFGDEKPDPQKLFWQVDMVRCYTAAALEWATVPRFFATDTFRPWYSDAGFKTHSLYVVNIKGGSVKPNCENLALWLAFPHQPWCVVMGATLIWLRANCPDLDEEWEVESVCHPTSLADSALPGIITTTYETASEAIKKQLINQLIGLHAKMSRTVCHAISTTEFEMARDMFGCEPLAAPFLGEDRWIAAHVATTTLKGGWYSLQFAVHTSARLALLKACAQIGFGLIKAVHCDAIYIEEDSVPWDDATLTDLGWLKKPLDTTTLEDVGKPALLFSNKTGKPQTYKTKCLPFHKGRARFSEHCNPWAFLTSHVTIITPDEACVCEGNIQVAGLVPGCGKSWQCRRGDFLRGRPTLFVTSTWQRCMEGGLLEGIRSCTAHALVGASVANGSAVKTGRPLDVSGVKVIIFDELHMAPLEVVQMLPGFMEAHPDIQFICNFDELQTNTDDYNNLDASGGRAAYYNAVIDAAFPFRVELTEERRLIDPEDWPLKAAIVADIRALSETEREDLSKTAALVQKHLKHLIKDDLPLDSHRYITGRNVANAILNNILPEGPGSRIIYKGRTLIKHNELALTHGASYEITEIDGEWFKLLTVPPQQTKRIECVGWRAVTADGCQGDTFKYSHTACTFGMNAARLLVAVTRCQRFSDLTIYTKDLTRTMEQRLTYEKIDRKAFKETIKAQCYRCFGCGDLLDFVGPLTSSKAWRWVEALDGVSFKVGCFNCVVPP